MLVVGSAAPLLAQTTAQESSNEAKAKAEVRQVSDKLAAIEVPIGTEPAFRFAAY